MPARARPKPKPDNLVPVPAAPNGSKPAAGIACPACGGRPLVQVYTRYRPGAVVRVRRCVGCGHRIRTVERVESNAAPPMPQRGAPRRRKAAARK